MAKNTGKDNMQDDSFPKRKVAEDFEIEQSGPEKDWAVFSYKSMVQKEQASHKIVAKEQNVPEPQEKLLANFFKNKINPQNKDENATAAKAEKNTPVAEKSQAISLEKAVASATDPIDQAWEHRESVWADDENQGLLANGKRLWYKLIENKTKFSKYGIVAISVIALVIVGSFAYGYFSKVEATAISVDGQQVALVASAADAEKLLAEVQAESGMDTAEFKQDVQFASVRVKETELLAYSVAKEAISENIDIVIPAVELMVNGTSYGFFNNEATAKKILEEVAKSSLPTYKNAKIVVNSIEYTDKIVYNTTKIGPDFLSDTATAKKQLLSGKQESKIYIVLSGDSLSTIASKVGMKQSEIRKNNPELTEDNPLLHVGQKIKLTQMVPSIHAVIKYSVDKNISIPYTTKIKNDSSMDPGTQKTLQAGVLGEKRIVYDLVAKDGLVIGKNLVSQEIIKPATTKIIVKSTRIALSSRSGSSGLNWPISSRRINAYFGSRSSLWSSSRHTGLDIDAYYGQAVYAAASGTVISASWGGSYGYEVVISHSGGALTRYGHCSKLLVHAGQSVTQGQIIAKAGSTGNSTGTHLHFEVIVSGICRNPLPYLR
ncbi:MAG: peptidoglycan DD-metalloendopeptidase family protein [Clostridia bacterium]